MARKRPYSPNQPTYASSIAEAPTELWIPRPAQTAVRRSWKPVLIVVILVILAALFALLAGGAALLYYSDWILPGVSALGIDLGSRIVDEAEADLAAHWQSQVILLEAEGTTWEVAPEKLGITLDTAATTARAHQAGRSVDSFQQWLLSRGQTAIAPVWQIDLAAAKMNLQQLAGQFEIAPQNAGVELVNGRFTTTAPVYGRTLDIASALAWLEQSAAPAVTTNRLQLPTKPVAPAISDVSGAVDEANRLLGTAVAICAYDPVTDETANWVINPEQWGQWLELAINETDPAQFDWSLDEAAAGAFLSTQAQALGSDRFVDVAGAVTAVTAAIKTQNPNLSLRIYHHPQQHIVQPGETFASIGRAYGVPYPWVQQANPGVSDALFAGQTLTIPSPDDLLPLPVVENKRLIVSISQQKMWTYENGALKWEWLASTGIDDSPTSPGVFQIQTHETNAYAGNWDLWMPYFMGIYQPVPTSDFMNGFHGFPTRDGQNLLWTGSLGHQVTYGCILVSTANAAQLYDWAEAGVVVEIRP